jgi:hypothetical protein
VRGTIDGDVAVQLGRGRDGNGVDAVADQRFGVFEGGAAEIAGDSLTALAVRIGDANQRYAGQLGQHAGMIATHNANAHDADAQRASAYFLGITHDAKSPSSRNDPDNLRSTPYANWRPCVRKNPYTNCFKHLPWIREAYFL